MKIMGTVLSGIVALIIILPALLYVFIFILIKQTTGNHRMAVNAAINTTTFVLIFSVHYLILTIWSKSLIWVVLLCMLSVASLFTFIYWKKKEEIEFPRVFTGVWRLQFLLLSIIYIGLLLYGVAIRAMEAIA